MGRVGQRVSGDKVSPHRHSLSPCVLIQSISYHLAILKHLHQVWYATVISCTSPPTESRRTTSRSSSTKPVSSFANGWLTYAKNLFGFGKICLPILSFCRLIKISATIMESLWHY